jgi:RNA polymerase sigma-70 factor (ECF subfamily)
MRAGAEKFDPGRCIMKDMTGDADLVHAVRRGDAPGLAVLLERHRAAMHAVAVSLLGWGADAEDAVQDAMLAALQRIGDLRDPAAAGPWLKAITRNNARQRLRSADRAQSAGDHLCTWPATGPTAEELLDRYALRDWLWSALETLSEPLQLAVLLRYFTDAGSYQQIADVCGVPVGTVRSRLSEARRRLTTALLASSTAVHDEADRISTHRCEAAYHLIESAARGQFRQALAEAADPGLDLIGPQRQHARGLDTLVQIMDSDLQAGVQQHPMRATAGRHVTILECRLLSPPWDPQHCPPGVLWLMKHAGARIGHITLFHPQPQHQEMSSTESAT